MRVERQGARRVSAAFDKLRRDLFRGVTEDNVNQLTARLHDREVMQPFTDVMVGLIVEWALTGADNGRKEIERNVYGTV